MDATRSLFLSLIAVLASCGLLMVHSASVTSWPTEADQIYLSRHAVFVLLGGIAALGCSCIPASRLRQLAPWMFAGTVLLLVAVLVPGFSVRVNGARRWLRAGGISLQPSEFAKITLPLLLASLATTRTQMMRHWLWGTLPFLLPIGLVGGLVLVEPDLGTAAFLMASGSLCLFFAGWPLRNFIFGCVFGGLVLGFGVGLRPYQLERIRGFIGAWTDFDSAPYQLKQSLMTLGAGGVDGVGIGNGWQKLSFLPEANTDFVIAVVGEELGLVGTLGLVAVWLGVLLTGFRLLERCEPHSFSAIAGKTLIAQLVLQAAINVAVVTAMVPPKGIAHPLVSYGGSNLLVSFISVGLILSLTKSSADG
ncbi:FtsW/RodA/SpoVE family cell cycle protein [Thalassoroseus pseudoceratinae]|uniref:FtsW/RodA/SpoVE family cell cycle protein n=1 Tax=Thalassoroseus pseudoceratinae TaxID=2713176 RepID=UPI00141FB3D0|nr:putative peptidoglycan glycosyltransferase FtsW [Thalassoroseus pseudoceratinae]